MRARPSADRMRQVLIHWSPGAHMVSAIWALGAQDRMSMRVLVVTESFLPTLNGVTTSVCRVLEQLSRLGHDAEVIAPGEAPESFAGAKVHRLPRVQVREFPVGLPVATMESVFSRFAPDVVHAASPFVVSARALTLARRYRVPSVAIYQTDMPAYIAQHAPRLLGTGPETGAWRWIRRTHNRASRTLAPSSATLQALREHGVERTGLWRRGVDLSLFTAHRGAPDVAALRRRLAPGGELLVGYVGRLAPEKEVHRLAEAAGMPGTRLVVVGDGPDRAATAAALARATRERGTGPEPVLLGRLEGRELAAAYAALDVFVHTGTKETFGQTLQEAAASHLPVVAPARGGPLDLIDHGRTGLLFEPDQPGSLRDQVGRLVNSPALREAIAAAGHAEVQARSWPALTAQLLEHYEAVRSPELFRAA